MWSVSCLWVREGDEGAPTSSGRCCVQQFTEAPVSTSLIPGEPVRLGAADMLHIESIEAVDKVSGPDVNRVAESMLSLCC